jgi:DNA-binding CsgD family transcriptional regulator/sugar-specific transcriptional regulator TrmB
MDAEGPYDHAAPAGPGSAPAAPHTDPRGRPHTDGLAEPPVGPTTDPTVDSELTESAITRVYLALLQQPSPSRTLLVAQGIPGDVVDRTLTVLHARGLIRTHPGGSWDVLPPDIALPAHAAELERRARAARGAAHELSQVFFQARSGDRPRTEGVRSLSSLDDLHSASAEIVSAARTSVRAMRNRSRRTEVLFAAPMTAHRERSLSADGTVLVMRTTYEIGVLEIPGAGEVLTARAEGGEQFRFVETLPFSVLVADEAAAVVDVSRHDPAGGGSLLVRNPALVRGLCDLVEAVWRLGAPAGRARTAGLDRRDTAILTLLAAGASDATIARQSGISQRTVERRVRALMDQLGAGTRFQAGVQAARRGWL